MYIWILVDNRVGSSKQAISLAEALCKQSLKVFFQKIIIKYTSFTYLPNVILSYTGLHILNKNTLLNWGTKPDLIISSGRKTGLAALFFKKRIGCKIIHIMNPPCNKKNFDFLILSKHDNISNPTDKMYNIVGVLHNITPKFLIPEATIFKKKYPMLYNNFIGILIGGNTRHYDFSEEEGNFFLHLILRLTKKLNLIAFISFSQRTPDHIKKNFNKNFSSPHIIYDSNTGASVENPYLQILASAKFLIVTGDSISMCSECSGSGKPLYIYVPSNFNSNKHLKLIDYFQHNKLAKILTKNSQTLEYFKQVPICPSEQVATYLLKKFNIP